MQSYQKVFVSYARADDTNNDGQIKELESRTQKEIATLTGRPQEDLIFLDANSIDHGHDWQASIDKAIASSAIFLPFYSPAFFQSQNCRNELRAFHESARSLGLEDQILGVYYVDIEGFAESEDPDHKIANKYQYRDFRDLRFEATASPATRRFVNGLASRIVNILNQPPPEASIEESDTDRPEPDDSADLLAFMANVDDLNAALESSMAAFKSGVEQALEPITELMNDAANASGRTAAKALIAKAADAAKKVTEPVGDAMNAAEEISRRVDDMEPGVRFFLDAPRSQFGSDTSVLDSIGELADIDIGTESLAETKAIIRQIGSLSRPLRSPMDKLARSLSIAEDATNRLIAWGQESLDLKADLKTS